MASPLTFGARVSIVALLAAANCDAQVLPDENSASPAATTTTENSKCFSQGSEESKTCGLSLGPDRPCCEGLSCELYLGCFPRKRQQGHPCRYTFGRGCTQIEKDNGVCCDESLGLMCENTGKYPPSLNNFIVGECICSDESKCAKLSVKDASPFIPEGTTEAVAPTKSAATTDGGGNIVDSDAIKDSSSTGNLPPPSNANQKTTESNEIDISEISSDFDYFKDLGFCASKSSFNINTASNPIECFANCRSFFPDSNQLFAVDYHAGTQECFCRLDECGCVVTQIKDSFFRYTFLPKGFELPGPCPTGHDSPLKNVGYCSSDIEEEMEGFFIQSAKQCSDLCLTGWATSWDRVFAEYINGRCYCQRNCYCMEDIPTAGRRTFLPYGFELPSSCCGDDPNWRFTTMAGETKKCPWVANDIRRCGKIGDDGRKARKACKIACQTPC